MCDTYEAKCIFSTFKKCDFEISFHLAGFETKRYEIAIVCPEHNTDEIKEIMPAWYEILFTEPTEKEIEFWKEKDPETLREMLRLKEKLAGKRILVLCFTENAKKNADGNHPNVVYPWKIVAVKGLDESLLAEEKRYPSYLTP